MEVKHTLGPWQWIGDNLEGADYQDVIAPRVKCGVWCQGGLVELGISDANERLIAAAPDLLEALQGLLPMLQQLEDKVLEGDEGCLWGVEAVRAAIAKATGE